MDDPLVMVECARCGAQVDEVSDEFLSWEAIGNGQTVVCEGCITGVEAQDIVEDYSALGDSIEAAGLGPGTDLETMGDNEYAMREDLASVLYSHEPDADPPG